VESIRGDFIELQLNLPGKHQGHNASLVVVTSEILQENGWNISAFDLQNGIRQTECPLRTEVIQTKPVVVLDAAHNVASIEALLETLAIIPARSRTVLFAAARDKDPEAMLTLLKEKFNRIILTEFQSNPRAVPLPELVKLAEKSGVKSWETVPDPESACKLLQQQSAPDELICVTGSFFLAVEIRELLKTNEQ